MSAAPTEAELFDPARAEPLPAELSGARIRRGLLALAAVVALVAAAVALVPGLSDLRESFAGARPGWLALAVVLEGLSCASYVLLYRGVFCRRMSPRVSSQIGLSALATNSVLSVGGAGGLALAAWILRRSGMAPDRIARRTVAFFVITSLTNFSILTLGGLGLLTGLLGEAPGPALALLPLAAGLLALGLALAVRPLTRGVAGRIRRPRLATGVRTLADGMDEALRLLRTGDPQILAGAAGYLLFDVVMLGVCFAAFGNDVPGAGVLLVAFILGQLGGLLPIPGGIGGVDGGLIGALVLYGIGATEAAVAVIAYRVVLLWLPLALGLPALAALRRRLRTEQHDIAACSAGEEVEVVGAGRVQPALLGREGRATCR